MSEERLYAVDGVHEDQAVLIDDHGRALSRSVGDLPPGVAAGWILRIPVRSDGEPDFGAAAVDRTEMERRRRAQRKLLEDLEQEAHGPGTP